MSTITQELHEIIIAHITPPPIKFECSNILKILVNTFRLRVSGTL